MIIVNWNSVPYLRNCLRSIYDKVGGLSFEVIVIDNASYDGSATMCAVEFPQALFLQADQNLGFSRANNQAFLRSRGSTILFLNPDTEILNDAVVQMYTHLHSRPNIGAVGCRVLNSDLSLQFRYVQAFPSLWNQILTTNYLLRLWPRSTLWGHAPTLQCNRQSCRVDVICGCCVMVKRGVYEKIGGFDEDYFMYVEDVALCHAIWQSGWEIHYVFGGSIIHHGAKSSSTTKETHFSDVMLRASHESFFRKSRGPLYARLFRVATATCALGRLGCLPFLFVLKVCVGKPSGLPAMRRKWWKLLRWSVGLEPSERVLTPFSIQVHDTL